jgi:hypothetical protein
MSGGLVYHWRHGWIPRTPTAALQKAHGSRKGADKIMAKHGIKGDLPGHGGSKTPHPAPHTLKPGDHATVHGIDDSGSPIQFTGKVSSKTPVTVRRGGKSEPMLSIGVERDSATTGRPRTDSVLVPDPNRASTPAKPKADASRARVRDLSPEGNFSGSHSETFMGEKITVRKTQWGKHETLINGEPFSAGYGSRNKDGVTALDQARKSIETMKSSKDPKYNGLYGMKTDAPSASNKRVQIEHSGDGTTLTIDRNDTEARQAAKDAGFRWSSNLGAWYLPRTQHESTRRAKVAQLRRKLGDGNVHVSDGGRGKTTSAAEREAAGRASAAARADRMDARASKLSAESEARRKASDAITEHIPMGQPILVGHHSQRRHERALERAHSNDRKSWEAAAEAKRAEAAAAQARKTAAGETPLARQRRIDRNEAEIRKIDRELSDHQLASKIPADSPIAGRVAHMRASQDRLGQLSARRAELADQVAHDKSQIAASGHTTVTSKDVTAGDMVTYRGRTHIVTKVNKTTVSVPSGYSWDDKIPLNQVQRHVPLSTQSDDAIRNAYHKAADPKVKNVLRAELLRRGLKVEQ